MEFVDSDVERLENEGGRPFAGHKGSWGPGKSEAFKLLQKVTLRTLAGHRKYMDSNLVSLPGTATLSKAVELMASLQLSCIPIMDSPSPGGFSGFVDTVDIAAYLSEHGMERHRVAELLSTPLSNLINLSGKDIAIPAYEDDPASSVLRLFVAGLQRVPLFNKNDVLVGICTQLDVIRFLVEQFRQGQLNSVKNTPLHGVKGRDKESESTLPQNTMIQAICKMVKFGRRFLAIVEPKNGMLVGGLSARSLVWLFKPSTISGLEMTVENYTEQHSQTIMKPLYEQVGVTLEQACKMMATHRAHQLFLVESLESMVFAGSMSLRDLCEVAIFSNG
jgi:CBS domain-containing protein